MEFIGVLKTAYPAVNGGYPVIGVASDSRHFYVGPVMLSEANLRGHAVGETVDKILGAVTGIKSEDLEYSIKECSFVAAQKMVWEELRTHDVLTYRGAPYFEPAGNFRKSLEFQLKAAGQLQPNDSHG